MEGSEKPKVIHESWMPYSEYLVQKEYTNGFTNLICFYGPDNVPEEEYRKLNAHIKAFREELKKAGIN